MCWLTAALQDAEVQREAGMPWNLRRGLCFVVVVEMGMLGFQGSLRLEDHQPVALSCLVAWAPRRQML